MSVIVDTSVWSIALRRRVGNLSPQQRQIEEDLSHLVRQGRVRLLGPIRQELLSGIRAQAQYARLRADLRAFDDVPLTVEDYEEAARACNHCRARGVAGSAVDFLICAAAIRRDWRIFTTDADFHRYAKHLPLRLHRPMAGS